MSDIARFYFKLAEPAKPHFVVVKCVTTYLIPFSIQKRSVISTACLGFST